MFICNQMLSGEDLGTISDLVFRQYQRGIVVEEKSGFKHHWSPLPCYLEVEKVQIGV